MCAIDKVILLDEIYYNACVSISCVGQFKGYHSGLLSLQHKDQLITVCMREFKPSKESEDSIVAKTKLVHSNVLQFFGMVQFEGTHEIL